MRRSDLYKYSTGIILIAFIIVMPDLIRHLLRFRLGGRNDSTPQILSTPWKPPALSLDSIFSEDHTWVSEIPSDKKWTLIATGDVIPARSVNAQTVRRNDFTWGWEHIIPILSTGDITLINLESPLVPLCPVTESGMVFCGSQRHIEGLKAGSVTVASFANNHMGNYGKKGILETKQIVESNNIRVSGLVSGSTCNPERTKGVEVSPEQQCDAVSFSDIEMKGLRIAFLGFDDIGPNVPPIAKADEELMKQEIIKAKNQADVVIVSMNWGVEYTEKPTDRQVFLAHLAIDSGADLIIGNHPHWIQPVEIYKSKMIMYAHGNTIFDQMWSEKTKEGVIGKYTFYGKDLVDVEFFPTYIKDYGQPTIPDNERKKMILDDLKRISQDIAH